MKDCMGCDTCSFQSRHDARTQPFAKAYGKLPFEIHVTVEKGNVEHFKAVCAGLAVKPLLIAMQLSHGGVMNDLMTSSKHEGTNTSVKSEMQRITKGLILAGYKVTRQKIETAPWHPDAPQDDNDRRFEAGQYFESHIGVIHNAKQRGYLERFAALSDLHLSSNAFKEIDEDTQVTMMTLRAHAGSAEQFKQRVGLTAQTLRDYGFVIDREIIEFAWFDSNHLHDATWTGTITSHQRLPS